VSCLSLFTIMLRVLHQIMQAVLHILEGFFLSMGQSRTPVHVAIQAFKKKLGLRELMPFLQEGWTFENQSHWPSFARKARPRE